MKLLAATVMSLSLMAPLSAHADEARTMSSATVPRDEDVRKVAPALEKYTRNALLGDLWKRPDLSPRDRSIVTLAARSHAVRGSMAEASRARRLAGVISRDFPERAAM